MKQITFRELLNLMYEGKAPKQVKYKVELYEKYGYHGVDYHNAINDELLSSVIGEDITLSLMAHDENITIYDDILDEKEIEYLSNVIKPFRKYVYYILKVSVSKQEQIVIKIKDYHFGEKALSFPTFKRGTMYKGMELWKEYTLEELGL